MRSKRGAYFFLIDVFLVVLIFFITLMTILSFRSTSPSLLGVDQQLDTYTQEFFEIEIRDYDSPNMTVLKLPGGAIYENDWNKQLTIDELISLMMASGYTIESRDLINESILELPRKYGFNYTIDDGSGRVEVVSRKSLVPIASSTVKLSERKVSWPKNNLTTSYDPVITEVSIWQ